LKKFEQKLQRLVGNRGTKKEISRMISKIVGSEIKIGKANKGSCLEGETKADIVYCFNAGMDEDIYLDFDVFVLKTRNHKVLYITEINGVN